jgi:predicted nucleic-acid-binding Zn-ribbon protein
MDIDVKCPKCGNTEFLLKVEIDVKIDPNRNFGNIKYDWIKSCTCANLACGHTLGNTQEEEDIKERLLNIMKDLLVSMREETLIIK